MYSGGENQLHSVRLFHSVESTNGNGHSSVELGLS